MNPPFPNDNSRGSYFFIFAPSRWFLRLDETGDVHVADMLLLLEMGAARCVG